MRPDSCVSAASGDRYSGLEPLCGSALKVFARLYTSTGLVLDRLALQGTYKGKSSDFESQ
jgi:hypothetical protein